MFQPIEHGFRPCHRCRPDLNVEYHNSYIAGSEIVDRALKLIYDGFLNYHSVDQLAAEVFISPRQLRKLFIDSIGIPPVKVGRSHKALFARKLLLGSTQPVTEIAMAAGFRSVRQFNDTYKEIFGESPRNTRRRQTCTDESPAAGHAAGASILIRYRQPFDFRQMLAFMQPRLISGVEAVNEGRYMRTFRTGHAEGWFAVTDRPDQSALELSIHSDDVRCYMEVYYRVRKMFDLDTDFTAVDKLLGADPLLRRGMTDGHVPGLPAAFDPFEFVIRAILGQQITVKAATTLAGRIAERTGVRCSDCPDPLQYFFPAAEEIAAAKLDSLGITGTRQQTIRTVTEALLDGRLKLTAAESMDEFSRSFGVLKGIGAWTVNYTAMRGLGMKDAFPAADLGIIKAMTPPETADQADSGGKRPTVRQIEAASEQWRPYRSYAALCLWNIPKEG